jgi:hypothetical protein
LRDNTLDIESLGAVLEEPGLSALSLKKEGEWPPTIEMANEAPYLAPHSLDLKQVQSLIQARTREWEHCA